MKNKKGFTLIELLSVIIILGIIIMIAVPNITQYLLFSKKRIYLTAGEQYLRTVKNNVNDLRYNFVDLDTSYYVPIECVDLGKGGQSPFGEWMEAYVIVALSSDGKYNYYWTSLDSAGYKMNITPENEFKDNQITPANLDLDTNIGIGERTFIEKMDKTTCEMETRVEAISQY